MRDLATGAERRRHGRASAVPAVAAVLAFLVLLAAAAGARADLDVAARFGHGGNWVAECATPLDVTLRNTGSAVVTARVTVSLTGFGEGGGIVHERRVAVAPGVTRVEGFLLPGPTSLQPDLTLEVDTEPRVPIHFGDRTADRSALVTPLLGLQRIVGALRPGEVRAIGVIADVRSVLASRLQGVALARRKGDPARALAFLPVDAEALRLAPHSLDGFEMLVVCDPDATFCADPARLDALLDWTAGGGRLLVTLGENAASFAASPLAPYLPATFGRTQRADYLAIASLLLREDTGTQRLEGPVTPLTPAEGARVSAQDLVAERAFGDGSLVVAACDLRLLAALPLEEKLTARLAIPFLGADEDLPWEVSRFTFEGEIAVADPVGRILQQEAFRPPSLPVVLFALFLYVLVVGPLDWVVLRRIRKERYTTFTFAAAVAVFTVVAYAASYTLFATDSVVNRVTFIHLSEGGREGRELVRVHDVAGFYAPNGGSRELEYGVPGAVLGNSLPGLSSSGVGTSLPVHVRATDPMSPSGEVEIGFRSQCSIHASLFGTAAQTVEVTRGPVPDTVVVSSTLPVDLEDCEVYLPTGHVCRVGRVPARGTATSPVSGRVHRTVPTLSLSEAWDADPEANSRLARRYLADVVSASHGTSIPVASWRALRQAGIAAPPPRAGRALLVATADELPFPLAGDGENGRNHVVVWKEVPLE